MFGYAGLCPTPRKGLSPLTLVTQESSTPVWIWQKRSAFTISHRVQKPPCTWVKELTPNGMRHSQHNQILKTGT